MHERIKYQAALYRIGGQEEKIDICQTAGDCVPSAIALEKRCALMPHELALQAREAVLQADDNFLKIGRIVATFLKIVRIFQNRDVLGVI